MSSIGDVQTANWILTGAAVVLTAGRLAIRTSNRHRLRGDDYTLLFALCLLIIHGATNQVTLDAKAQQKVNIASHLPASTLLQDYRHLHVLNTVNNVFLYAIMWIIKVAFLLLYRQVFNCHKTFIRMWWVVLGFAVLSYIPPFAMVVHTCAGASTLADYKACNSGTSFRTAKLITTCVLNVVSDVMIMALPLWMLGQLQMNIRHKVGLSLVFCVAIFCIALDILRTAEAVAQHQDLFTVIEVNFTVIVFCLPTYSQLLAGKNPLSSRKSLSHSSRGRSNSGAGWSDNTRLGSSIKSQDTVVELDHAQRKGSKNLELSAHEAHSVLDVESQSDLISE